MAWEVSLRADIPLFLYLPQKPGLRQFKFSMPLSLVWLMRLEERQHFVLFRGMCWTSTHYLFKRIHVVIPQDDIACNDSSRCEEFHDPLLVVQKSIHDPKANCTHIFGTTMLTTSILSSSIASKTRASLD